MTSRTAFAVDAMSYAEECFSPIVTGANSAAAIWRLGRREVNEYQRTTRVCWEKAYGTCSLYSELYGQAMCMYYSMLAQVTPAIGAVRTMTLYRLEHLQTYESSFSFVFVVASSLLAEELREISLARAYF